jgi:Tfp pilus assembly protein PilO
VALTGGNKLKSAVDHVVASVRRVRMTPVEIVALAGTILFAGAVLFFYVFEVRSRRTELDGLDARDRAAHSRILEATTRKKKLEAQRSNASQIIDSIGSFEKRLKNRELGTPAIITEVNSLAKQHRAVAGDYAYKVVEGEAEVQAKESASSKRAELPNTYTALGIDTTVVGDYADLKRLISAIERSPLFIVINSLAFQGEADKSGQAGPPPGMAPVMPTQQQRPVQNAAPGGMAVSLKIEMQTFFRNELKQP